MGKSRRIESRCFVETPSRGEWVEMSCRGQSLVEIKIRKGIIELVIFNSQLRIQAKIETTTFAISSGEILQRPVKIRERTERS